MHIDRRMALGTLAAVIALALAGGWYYADTRNKAAGPEDPATTMPAASNNGSGTAPAGAAPSEPGPGAAPAAKPPARLVSDVTASSLTHTQAATIFANTLLAFQEGCGMVPKSMFVQNGATLMFDNRSRDARTFKLDGVSYTIPGYGFKLFQLRSSKLPHVVPVECGQNTGEITLQ